MKGRWWWILGLLPLLAMILVAAGQRGAGSTAPPAPAADRGPRVRAEGRVAAYPGADVVLGSEIAGRIVDVPVSEKAAVRKGQVVLTLDGSEQAAALVEARAMRQEAATAVEFRASQFRRYEQLRNESVESEETLDRVRHERDVAEARLRTAEATIGRLEAALAKTRLLAPIDGVVLERLVHPGELVSPGTPLLHLADLHRLRIEAEVDEYDAGKIEVGQSVVITTESRAGDAWKGVVEEVPDAIGLRHLRPQDAGKPLDTGVLLVKVALNDSLPLLLGQRVEVEIRVGP